MTLARHADRPIDPAFLARWSPRAFDGSPVDHDTMMTLFEAARWAPSAFNVQPWRFLYALNGSRRWDDFVGCLAPFNQSWAGSAAALVVVLSDTLIAAADGALKPSHSHSFDAGAAWAMLALQGGRMGLAAHAMTGVDFDAVRARHAVPARFRIECMVAIGRCGDPAQLPPGLQAREGPSPRRPAAASVFADDLEALV